jgi:hypothetical protein
VRGIVFNDDLGSSKRDFLMAVEELMMSQGTEFPGRDDRKILPFVRIEQVKLTS